MHGSSGKPLLSLTPCRAKRKKDAFGVKLAPSFFVEIIYFRKSCEFSRHLNIYIHHIFLQITTYGSKTASNRSYCPPCTEFIVSRRFFHSRNVACAKNSEKFRDIFQSSKPVKNSEVMYHVRLAALKSLFFLGF